jgi:hypothetical protein
MPSQPQTKEQKMGGHKRDKRKVDPLSGGEEAKPAKPLETVPKGRKANATSAVIPGTGQIVKDLKGQEAKRVVDT